MLELKRKALQAVQIGQTVTMTVLELDEPIVRVRIDVEDASVLAPLTVGRTYRAEVDGSPVEVQLARIDRGEAVFRFEAERHLLINRAERVNR